MQRLLMNSPSLNPGKPPVIPNHSASHISHLENGWHIDYLARYQPDLTDGLTAEAMRESYQQHSDQQRLAARRQHYHSIATSLAALPPAISQAITQAKTDRELDDLYLTFEHAANLNTLSFSPEKMLINLLKTVTDLDQTLSTLQTQHAPKLHPEQLQAILHQHLAWQLSLKLGLRQTLRNTLQQDGMIKVTQGVATGKMPTQYQQWLDKQTTLVQVSDEQLLNLLQGQRQQWLLLTLTLPASHETQVIEQLIQYTAPQAKVPSVQAWLQQKLADIWATELLPCLQIQILMERKQQALAHGLTMQMRQLAALFLQAPLGNKPVLGIVPGLRSGIKIAAIDAAGQLRHHTTLYPHAPQNAWKKSKKTLLNIIQMAQIQHIAVGYGPGLKETDRFLCEWIHELPEQKVHKIQVIDFNLKQHLEGMGLNAAHDLGILHAASVARRIQDPLIELVSYPATVFKTHPALSELCTQSFEQSFKDMVSDCVAKVPLDLNEAPAAALQYVPGLNDTLAKCIVAYREQQGKLNCIADLMQIPEMSEMAYEQAAAYLRLENSQQPFDNAAIPPSAFPQLPTALEEHEPTSAQVATALKPQHKPLRDERGDLQLPNFNPQLKGLSDATKDMMLEGVITNIASFGAFVNIGIHEQALLHVSHLPAHFKGDPNQLKVGDVITARIIQINVERKRINLSLNPSTKRPKTESKSATKQPPKKQPSKKSFDKNEAMASAFADAFAKATN
jgi:protein Tex